jgi:hypothetical protein
MPMGKGTYGSKKGRPKKPKNMKGGFSGLKGARNRPAPRKTNRKTY